MNKKNINKKKTILEHTIENLKIKKNGIYLDCTFGCGNHSKLILNKLNNNGRLISIDRDKESVKIAKNIINNKFKIIHGLFSNSEKYLNKIGVNGNVDGIIVDLGLSSIQLNNSKRGFSYKNNGPLDMRMGINKYSAYDFINKSSEKTIFKVLKNFGEEKFSRKIAKNIKKYTNIKPIYTTAELSKIINYVNNKKKNKNPSTCTFMAIRMYINNELIEIKKLLKSTLNILKNGGILSIISFNSLEDRIVKKFIINNSKMIKINRNIISTENNILKLIKKNIKFKNIKKIKPSIEEIKKNPKIRSAILRIAEKI